jgi:hypothetical protein
MIVSFSFLAPHVRDKCMRVWINLAVVCGAALTGIWVLGTEQLALVTMRTDSAELVDIDQLALTPHLKTGIRARVGMQY